MRTIVRLILIVAVLAQAGESARAQRPLQVPRIGVLRGADLVVPSLPGGQSPRQSFLQGLQELGYVDGRSVTIEYRNAEGKIERLPELAADLVRLKVSVIVALGPAATSSAVRATLTIPIVMVDSGDPVGRGFVKSLSLPGGNVTGLSGDPGGRSNKKRLELLREAFPGVGCVALLNPRRRQVSVDSYARAAKAFGVNLETVDVQSPAEFETAFSKITSMRPDALITMSEPLSVVHGRQIAEFALQQRLPAMYESAVFVKVGGLMSYGVNFRATWRRAAFYVDKILKGADPAVLPVEPPQFEFVINLRTASKLRIAIPPELLLEADEVIK